MSEIKLNEITSGTTIKEMVEIINSNFTKIVESGGGPTGVPGEDGVAGPEGKRGKGIFVIKDESEIDEGKEYEKEVNEFLKNDSSDSEEGKYKEGDCIIYKSGLYIVKISPDDDNTLVAEYMGTLKGEKGDKGETGSNEEEGGSSNQWKIVDIHGNHYGYQFNGDYKFLIIGSGIDENKLGSYGAENDYNHSLWILDGEKGIALYGKENEVGPISKGTITFSNDDKLMLTGARGICVNGISFDKGEINYSGGLKLVTDFNTITLDNSGINLNSPNNGGNIILNTLSNIEITNGKNHITLTSTLNITGEDITLKCSGQCNVSGTNVSGTNASLPGGEITVDKTGVGLSGSGKGINIGVTALRGYDVDIVGKTYISGDLVVGGDYHNIGDLMVISSKKDTPEGWFSNEDLTTVKTIPIKYSNKVGTGPNIWVNFNTYQILYGYNNTTMTSLNENEFEKYFGIGKFINSEYNNSTNQDNMIIVGNGDALNTQDNFTTYREYFTEQKDFLQYLYSSNSPEDDLGLSLDNDDEHGYKSIYTSFIPVQFDNDSYSIIVFPIFDFNNKTCSNNLKRMLDNLYSALKSAVNDRIEWYDIDGLQKIVRDQIYAASSSTSTNYTFESGTTTTKNNKALGYIIINTLEDNYKIENPNYNKGRSLQVNDDFSLPTYNNDKYYKYIMKYKDSSVETVGRRDNENGD